MVKSLAFAPFHAQLGPFQVTMARLYGIRAKETGQNVSQGTRIVNELPRLNRSLPECIEIYCGLGAGAGAGVADGAGGGGGGASTSPDAPATSR